MNDNSNNRSRLAGIIIALVVMSLLLGGCSLFGRQSEYERISQERPLEIPPDLDAPSRRGALEVPGATPTGSATASASSAATPGATAPAGTPTSGRLFLVDDSADSTFERVGVALERLGVDVEDADDSARVFVVDYVDAEAKENRPGVFSRWILRKKGPEDLSGLYRLKVSPSGRGSAVTIEADDGGEAPMRVARDLLGALEQRLS